MYSISAVNTPYDLNKARVEDAYGARFSKGYQGVGRSIRDVADVIVAKVWSPSIFKNGTRNKESFLCSNWCVLDFDEGMTLNDALNTFCDTQHIIGTTKSHQTEKNGLICDRFRVCIPWEKQIIDAEHYQQNIERMIIHYDTDTSCSDPARLFYPCTAIISINDDPEA
ncbi:MAG: hypothetical protein HRT70_07970 [Flavobacteriaceae bacterium]|nr:hypothetical protein [Flavobacteriaceae bacterium]